MRTRKTLSPETAARMEETADAMFSAPSDESGTVSPRKALSFARMAGVGEKIDIGGKTYELAALPMVKQSEMHALLSTNPLILVMVMLAVSTDADGSYDYDVAAKSLSGRLSDPDGKAIVLDGTELDLFVSSLVNPVSVENAAAMAEVVAFALQRRHAGINGEDVLPHLDIPTFALAIEKIVTLNPGFTTRF